MWLKCRNQGGRHSRLMEIKGPEVGGRLTSGNGVQGPSGCPAGWRARGQAQGLRGHGCGETAVVAKPWPTFCYRMDGSLQSVGCLGQGRRRGLPFPFPGDLPRPGTGPPPRTAGDSSPLRLREARRAPRRVSVPKRQKSPPGHCSGPVRNGPRVSYTGKI